MNHWGQKIWVITRATPWV